VEYKIDYKNVLKSIADGMLVFDLEGYLVDVNQEFADFLGYGKNELIGKHAAELSPTDIPDIPGSTSLSVLEILVREGHVQSHETQYAAKDGGVIFAEVNISSLNDDEGNLTGYITAVRFIMDRKSEELKLRESEEFLRKIIINGPEYILVKDRNGKYVVASRTVAEYYGMSLDDLIGKTNFDFIKTGKMSLKDAERIMKSDLEVINDKKKTILEESVTLADGSKRWFQTTKIPLDRKGVSNYVLGISVEITDLKINIDVLEEKEKELELKNQSLTDLNTALRVLVDKKDENKTELEAKVVSSLKILVEPYLGKLEACCSSKKQKNFVEVLKTNLKEVISPFSLNLVSGYVNLSSSEIQVAGLIKNGLRNKEIAELINISVETVSVHRKNIRKKLGISNTKINLYSYLKTLQ
jgi:PAS domain S-box-containing protein